MNPSFRVVPAWSRKWSMLQVWLAMRMAGPVSGSVEGVDSSRWTTVQMPENFEKPVKFPGSRRGGWLKEEQ
jgi:hypothetical protein